jgi:signal transduction histidine kinase
LHDLLQNIVNNAIKYTKKGEVSLTISKHDNDITFAIKDTGIGISKTDRLKIFDRFYRSEDYRTRETGGTGLGLYVASRLAKQIGTKINLDSQINKGSTFSFTLPIKPKKVNSETESGKNKYV